MNSFTISLLLTILNQLILSVYLYSLIYFEAEISFHLWVVMLAHILPHVFLNSKLNNVIAH